MEVHTLLKEDITIYYPSKNGSGIYETIPCSFVGCIGSYSHGEDAVEFIKQCYLTKEECENACKRMNQEKELSIEIPFGAYDSELLYHEWTIPEGYVAKVKDGKVIVNKVRFKVGDTIRYKKDPNIQCTITDINYVVNRYSGDGWSLDIIEGDKLCELVDIKPKFKVGEFIQHKTKNASFTIDRICDGRYYGTQDEVLEIPLQDEWEVGKKVKDVPETVFGKMPQDTDNQDSPREELTELEKLLLEMASNYDESGFDNIKACICHWKEKILEQIASEIDVIEMTKELRLSELPALTLGFAFAEGVENTVKKIQGL